MSDYVEVTRKGLGKRGKDSIGGAFFGVILVAVGVILLFWNEGRSVKRYQDLKEGAGAVVSLPSPTVDSAMEGKLVHLSGETETSAPVSDPDFGMVRPAVRLARRAEIYQWVEKVSTKEDSQVGGTVEETKTYRYEK